MSILKGVKNKVWQPCMAVLPKDGGKETRVKFDVKFTLMSKSAFQTLIEDTGTDSDVTLSDRMPEFIHDWKLLGADNNPIEFNQDNLELVLENLDYSRAVLDSFHALHFGKQWKKIKAKN